MPGIGRPLVVPRTTYYDSGRDYSIDDSLNRVEYFSNAVMEDTYDAAVRSRGRDNALLRNANATIRPSSRASSSSRETRTGRPSKRFQSLPPRRESRSPSVSMAMVPYNKPDHLLKSLPSPSSFLSNRISRYLKGPSMPPRHVSTISYPSLLPDPIKPKYSDIGSKISNRSYLSDPSILSPLSPRSSSRLYQSYVPSSLVSYRRTPSRYTSYDDDEDEDYLDSGSYRRNYRSLSRPRAITYDDDDEDDTSSRYGKYSPSRHSGSSYIKLSNYEGPYDGSYAADMADMYEYVPFGPSRQGILELTSSPAVDYSSDYPALSYSSTDRYSPIPERKPSVSLIPQETKQFDNSLTKPSFTDNSMIDSLVSSTAARAKAVIAGSKLPYKNASLVLSVEGNALSEDGKNKYGFKYYPPPIPLTGGPIGLDERILGITPLQNSPADSFLGGYLNRLRGLRTDERDHMDSGRRASSTSSIVSSRTPSYSHRTIRMPLTISGRENSVPVSSYRSRLDGGQSHRVDVYPLVECEASVPVDRKYQLPMYSASGDANNRLTLLDRISIKAAIIGSRMESEGKVRRPKSQFASNKLRELKIQDIEEGVYYRPVVCTSGLHASHPPLKKPTNRKPIRTVEVSTTPKPTNLMSWKYRVESRVSPDDIIYEPASYARLRQQLRDVNGKMDRERQLLDRYLDTENMSKSTLRRAEDAKKIGGSVNIPAYYACGGDPLNRPVTELRRKIRRMVSKGKNNPNYYRMGLDD